MPADDETQAPATPKPQPAPAPEAPAPDRRRRLIIAGVVLLLLVAAAAAFVVVRKQRVARRLAGDYQRGLIELAQGDYFDALHSVGPYLNVNRADPAANFAYARAREAVEMPRDGHLGEAASFYRRGIQEGPAHVGADDARVRLARLYARLGGWSELLELTDAVRPDSAGDDPRRLELLRLRGVAQLEEGDARGAAETLAAYAQARPLDADAQLVALGLARRAGDAEAADARLRAVFAAAQGEDDPRLLLVRAGDAQLSGDAKAAADLAARAAGTVLEDGLPGEGEEDGEEDGEGFDEAVGRWVNRLTALLDATGQGPLGDELMVRLAGEFRDVDFRRRAANRLFQAGRFDAVLDMTAGESVDDGEGELLGLRALALGEAGDRDAAAAIAQGMAEREEGSRGRAWSLVIPHWRPGDGPAFGGARYPDEPDPAARRADVDAALRVYGHPAFVLMRAENLADLGEGVAAFEQFAGAAALAGRTGAWPRPVLQAGWQAADAGRGREATQAFIAARRLAPDSPTVNAATAALLAREGNPDEALQILDQFAETSPESADDPRVRAARVAASPDAGVTALADPDVPAALAVRVIESLLRQGRPIGPALDAAGGRLSAPTAAAVRAAAAGEAFDVGEVAGLRGPDGLASRLAILRRADPEAARAEALAVLKPAPAEDGADLLARRAALESDALDPSADAGAWRAARQSVAALAGAAGEAGARWATRLAVLDLARPGGEVDEAQLRENALTLGGVARQYPRFLDARVALIAVLERLDLDDEALEQLRLAAENNPENAAVRLAYAGRLAGRADGGGEALQEQLRLLADLAVAPRSPMSDAQREAVARLLEAQGQDERALAVLGAGGGREGDLRVLRLRRRAGSLDPADVRPLLGSGDAASLQFAAETFAGAGLDADADAALDALDALSAGDPEAARLAALARAAVDLARGRVAEARGQLDGLVAADPADPVARRLLVSSHLAEGDVAAAQGAAREAAGAVGAADAGATASFDAFAKAAADLSALADAARQDGGRAATLLRGFPQLARLLPDILVHDGPAEMAAVLASARAAVDAGDAEGAVESLAAVAQNAADAAPGSSAAQELAARLSLAAGDRAAALERARAHARQANRDPEAARLLVDALAAGGETAEAADAAGEWRSRLLRQAGDRATPQTTRAADLTLARLRLAQGQAGQALGHLRPHLAGRDADPAAATLAAEAHLDLGNGAAALSALGWPDEGPQLGSPVWTLWLRAAAAAGEGAGREVLGRMTDAADGGGPGLLYPLAQAWASLHASPAVLGGSARGPADEEAAGRVSSLLDAALAGREGEASAAEWEQVGVLAGMVGDAPRSVAAYRKALAMEPGQYRAANNLAMQLADPPDGPEPTPAEAAEALRLIDGVLDRPAVAQDPAYAAFLDTRAAALAATGDVAAAVAATERAAEREPRAAEWPLHRAEILAAAGDEAAARRAWRQFARLADPRTADPAIAARAARLADRLGERWR